MNDNEAAVRIVADASGVEPGVDVAKGEIAGLGDYLKQLNVQMAEMTAAMKEGFAQVAESLAESKAEMVELEEETEKEELSLKELALSAKEGAESISEMREAAMGFAEAFMAAFAVEQIADWAKEFAEASEHVEHLAAQFGMTTTQVQGLNVIAKQAGVSVDEITKGMGLLDRNLFSGKKNSLFDQLGISAKDAGNQIETLAKVADKFADMDDGPKKAALAMDLFGKSGTELIPILDRGGDAIRANTELAKNYGAAYTEVAAGAQEKGVALAESINTMGVAWQGVTNVLGDAFGPVLNEIAESINRLIKAFTDSYAAGGTVAVVLEAIAAVVEIVGAAIDGLVGIFKALWDAAIEIVGDIAGIITDAFGITIPGNLKTGATYVNVVKDAFIVLKDVVVMVIETIKGMIVFLIDYLRLMAVQAKDAFTLNWSAMDADWKAGCDRLATHVEDTINRVRSAAKEAQAAIAAAMNGETIPSGEKHEEPKEHKAHGFDPDLSTEKKKKEPKEKDDLVQHLQEQLTQQKLAWDMQQDAQDTAQAFSLESEKAFWAKALEIQGLSAKDREAIETKYLEASGKLRTQQIAGQLELFKQEEAAAGKNADAKLAIVQQEVAYIGKQYGLESDQYKAAVVKEVEARRSAEAQKVELAKVTQEGINKLNELKIAQEEADDKFLVEMGRMSQEQMLANERKHQTDLYTAQLQGLQQRATAMKLDPSHDPVAYRQLLDQIQQLELQHQTKMTQIDQQATLQRKQIASQTFTAFSQDIGKMLTLQETFGTGFSNMWKSVGNIAAQAVSHMVEAFLEGLIIQDVASGTLHAKEMMRHAEEAAAGAWKAVVGIPIVGPVLAPIAAAAAFAGVMAFSSAEGGDWNVTPGMYELHKEEMVLPAWAANPLRNMISSGAPAGNLNAPAPANDGSNGDTHFHFHGPVWDKRGVAQFLMENKAGVAAAMKGHVRGGGR